MILLAYLFIIFISIWTKLGFKRFIDSLILTCVISIPFGIMFQIYIILGIDTIYLERAIVRL